MKQEEVNKIANTIACCPYCKKMFRVGVGWYFADNPSAERDQSKVSEIYVSKQLSKINKDIKTGPQ